MKFITVTHLKMSATEVVRDIQTTHEEVIVTKNGKPVVLMQMISDDAFQLKENQQTTTERRKYDKRIV